jgi:hypothetical protein
MSRSERRCHLIRCALIATALVCVTFGAVVVPASAQVTTTVLGTVKDEQGGVLPGATVVLISESRGTKSEPVVTNDVGDFVLPNVLPDTYTIQVEMPSFKTLNRQGLIIGAEPRVVIGTLTLQVGGANEVIEVKAESPLIQAASGERSFSIGATAIENLPIANRNFTGLAGLAPGVDGTGRVGGGGDSNIVMDGVSTSSPGNNAIMIRLNTESVAEVRVLTSGYQAEYGRASGVQITSVTKSGTNRFRGSIYNVERNSDWNSNSRMNILNGDPKTVLRERDFGYSIGGPIGKPGGSNKLFFFHSHEIEPRTAGNNIVRFRLPTALERAGDFSRTTDNNGNLYPFIKDPNVAGACSAADQTACFRDGGVLGRIPTSQLYGPGLALLNSFPVPNIANVPPGQNYNFELTRPLEKATGWQPVVRIDYQPKSSLRATYRFAVQGQSGSQVFNGTVPGFNDTRMPNPVIATQVVSANYTFRPTIVFEGSYGRTTNELSGCALGGGGTPGPTFCTAGFPVSPVANMNNAGIGAIPLIFPDARAIDRKFYIFSAMEKLQSPIWDGERILLPPQFQFGSRVAIIPPGNLLTSFYNKSAVNDFNVNATLVRGRHTFKAGLFRLSQLQAQSTGGGGGAIGTLSFAQDTPGTNPFDTSFGFANAAIGTYGSYSQATRFVEYNSVIRSLEFYVQDNWKVNARLSLDYGVRFVHMAPDHDKFNQGSNFLPELWEPGAVPTMYVAGCANGVFPCAGANRQAMNPRTNQFLGPTSSVLIGTIVPGTGNELNGIRKHGEGIVEEGYIWPALAIAPRVGVAYDPTGAQKIVIRGSIGLFTDRTAANATRGSATNPPNSETVTLRFGQLQNLTSGLAIKGAPTLSGTWDYRPDDLPTSTQWNTGVQVALPYGTALDISYVGQHAFAQPISANINAVDFGAAFLADNQDRTLPASATLGATAISADLLRGIRGYGSITQNLQVGWRTFHSLQLSLQRRFRNGLSFGFNDTWSLYDHSSTALRFDHTADGRAVIRADQAEADRLLGTAVDQAHLMRANFVWDLPDLRRPSTFMRAIGYVVNDWQLSGLWTGRTGTPYIVNFSYQSGGSSINLTGSPDYAARVLVVSDPGSGCSGDVHRQFNTSAFRGPAPGSVGLESGSDDLRSCFSNVLDLAIARNFRLYGSRAIQLRADLFNAPNLAGITGRNTTMNLPSPSDPTTITNLPFDANGQLIDARSRPRGAGFGVANAYQAARSIQLQLRFTF